MLLLSRERLPVCHDFEISGRSACDIALVKVAGEENEGHGHSGEDTVGGKSLFICSAAGYEHHRQEYGFKALHKMEAYVVSGYRKC